MKRKKILLILLALCLALSLIPAAAFAASAELVIETPETLPKAGDDFTVTVSIRNNPGFNAIDLCLSFDSDQITCNNIVLGQLMKGTLSATNPSASDGAIISAATLNTIKGDGVLATYSFTADKSPSLLDFSITRSGMYNEDSDSISFTVVGGTLKTPAEPETPAHTGTGAKDDDPVTPPPAGNKDADTSSTAGTSPASEEAAETSQETAVTAEVTFNDVAAHWAKENVAKAVAKGLFNGYPDGSFKPDNPVSRAEFVTVLWRMAGGPDCTDTTPFTDVKATDWFAAPVAWAYSKGYINGISNTSFGPSSNVSREQAMTILFRYDGGVTGMEAMFTSVYDQNYTDSSAISGWARPALYWGVYNKLLSGTTTTTLSPAAPANRAQLAKILVYYIDEYIKD